MKRFEFIDHTADVGIIAYGTDMKEAFAGCAYAMFTMIVDMDTVGEVSSRTVSIQAEDQGCLLVMWLNELSL